MIVSVRFAVTAPSLLLPAYVATIASLPTGRVEVVRVATPFVIVPLPIEVPLLVNATVPVTLLCSVAVNVTGRFACCGFADELSVMVGDAFVTVCVVDAVLVLYVLSPLYVAVIVSDPVGSTVVVIEVADPASVPVPSVMPPLVKVTVPVAPEVTVDEIVTEFPYTLGPEVDTVTVDVSFCTV